MADNRYREYLDENRRSANTSGDTLGALTAVGAGVGLLASGRFRRGTAEVLGTAGRTMASGGIKLASYLNRTGRIGEGASMTMSYLKAMDHALDNRSPLSHFLNPARYEQRFTAEMRRQLDQTMRYQSNNFSRATQIEQSYAQLAPDLRKASNSFKQNIREELVIRDLKKRLPIQQFGDLEGILKQFDPTFFGDPGEEKIRGLLQRFNKGGPRRDSRSSYSIDVKPHEEQQFMQTMLSSLQVYQDTKKYSRKSYKKGGTTLDHDLKIQGAADLREIERNSFLEKNKLRENFWSKMMEGAGYRPMQVRDMLEQDANGKWVNKLFDNAAIVKERKDGSARGFNVGSKLATMANKDARYLDLMVDNRIFINGSGDIKDFRAATEGMYETANFIQRNFQLPYLRFNPLDLIHWTTIQNVKEAASTYFMRRGTIHPLLEGAAQTVKHPSAFNQDAAATPLARDYMYSGDKVYDVLIGEVIKDNVYLTSARFGMMPRALASMANLHKKNYAERGFLGKLFDVGAQETESVWSRAASTFTKFDDPDWSRNRFKAVLRKDNDLSDVNAIAVPSEREKRFGAIESSYKDLYAEMHTQSRVLSDDTAHYINRYSRSAYGQLDVDLTKLNTNDEIMQTLGRINAGMKEGHAERGELQKQISDMWEQYRNDKDAFLKNKRILSSKSPYMMGPFQAVDAHEVNLISKVEDAKRLIHQHAILQMESRAGVTIADVVRQGIQSGDIGREALEQTRDLKVLTQLHSYWDDVYKNGPLEKEKALMSFQGRMFTDDAFRANFSESIQRHSPIWSMGPGDQPPQPFGFTGSTIVGKARGYGWMIEDMNKQIQQGINPIKAFGKSAWGVLGQPFSGRRNLGDVTTASMIPYYMAERLDNMAAKIGLGLSQQNRGSMQSIMMNQFGRRIVLPYVAIQQAMYFDGMTGDTVSDKLADTYANMTIDVARAKDLLGLNSWGNDLAQIFPGSDQFWKTPIGGLLKYGSFGLLGDGRSGEEMERYYQSGEDEVRKGRWWGVGSNTPWEGGKIDRFEPNWYRKLKSDYKFTSTMYGSEGEYWANHWMPTLTHPFAPLRHFLFDPDYYANKHKEDRPYAVTGGIEEFEMIPLIGGALNGTIGQLLNPNVERSDLAKAHRQYQEDLNAYIESQYQSATGDGMIQFMPAGGYQVMSPSTFGGGFGEGMSLLTAPGQYEMYSAVGGSGGGGESNASSTSKAQLAAMNMYVTSQAGGGGGLGGGMMSPVRPITTLSDLRDPDALADLADYTRIGGMGNTVGDTWYSLTEMAGIYGFSANMFAGLDTNIRSSALEHSSRFGSYQRAWWDMEMGGLGGDISELFRRYVPRDPRKQYYNPIRNTMPEWMPGLNYYIDFQHGDPYGKVAKGEMRLPGEAYERLNRLHPDQFGDYGAFDRFKILGDVAPYSDEYRFWRRMVSQMSQQGLLNDDEVAEYAEVRDQVAAKKSKYHFYPNRFRNADIIKEDVTITRVLDQNTFLTAEHPNNPIRLANVHVKSDAAEAQEFLKQYIYEGARLQIGVNADPINRISDDTMNTMHAVVYSNGENDRFMGDRGQSVNGLLARKFRNDPDQVTVKVENTAVGTNAMFDSADITVGKLNEWMVHDMLPNLPILGPIFDKFLQVRSPLEMYKKNEVYGKAWRPWTDPWSGWIQPMLERAASANPLVAAAQGYGIGWLTGKATKGRYYGKWAGAATFGTLAALRSIDEFVGSRMPGGDNYAWLPERRKREREINEYFDIIKYMKYRGLYERAKDEALHYEGIDLDKVLDDSSSRGDGNKQQRKYLETMKKWLSISKDLGYVDDDVIGEQLDKVRSRLKGIDGDRSSMSIGPRAMLALQYKLQYESTLYGADPNGDMTKIFRALPNKDREFFTEFMTASPSEREEILRLVPKDQRRFYQAKWGMETDDKQSLSSYFSTHYLPGTDWEGWRPDVNLDDVKLKVVRNEGLDATEFGMWADDAKRAEASGIDAVQPFRPSMSIDVARIEKVLQGAGLSDVTVSMTTSPYKDGHRLDVAFDYIQDRTEEIKQELANNIGSIFA